jgi:SNF2 family DNA or RNA helicase
MGQTRPVSVYRLVAQGTIDDALCAMQADKSRLNDALLKKGDADDATAESVVAPSVMAELLQAALAMLQREA